MENKAKHPRRTKMDTSVPPPPPLRSLLTVRQLAERYTCFTEPAIRALILNARDRLNRKGEKVAGNGLDRAIVRCGRKLLLDEQLFLEFLSEQSKRARAGL